MVILYLTIKNAQYVYLKIIST